MKKYQFLYSATLNDHFHHLSLSPSSGQGKLNLLSYLFTFGGGGGISFLSFYKFLLSHFPPPSHLPVCCPPPHPTIHFDTN